LFQSPDGLPGDSMPVVLVELVDPEVLVGCAFLEDVARDHENRLAHCDGGPFRAPALSNAMVLGSRERFRSHCDVRGIVPYTPKSA